MKCNTDRSTNLSFNLVADLYDVVRPGYPDQLYSDILNYCDAVPPFYALEIGCGTGQATISMAKKGITITAVEPGNELARIARRNSQEFGNLDVVVSTFEEVKVPSDQFQLVYSATAFHWVPAEIAYFKSQDILVSGGTLAVFWNLMPQFSDQFRMDISKILEAHEPSLLRSTFGTTSQQAIREGLEELKESGFFYDEQKRTYNWNIELNADNFTKLLETFANYQVLSTELKQDLFLEIRDYINQQHQGKVNLEYTTVLNLAKKRQSAATC